MDGFTDAQRSIWHCPEGSHLAMYDDADRYFEGLISFVKRVDQETKKVVNIEFEMAEPPADTPQ